MTATTTTTDARGYTSTAKILHWTLAVLVVGAIVVGLSLESLPEGETQDTAYFLHKSTGILILALMLVRIVWRLTHRPPPHASDLPRWQVGLSHAVHWTLYAILLTMPLLGWSGSNAYGAPVSVFGLFTMPTLLAENKPLAESLFAVHGALGFVAAGLICVHVSAALYHGLIRHDTVLQRMT